jgi:hypothetical protein
MLGVYRFTKKEASMGRPERPLDPAAGPLQRLAHERELRRAAGNPSYRTMAAATGMSPATLS